MGQKTRTESSGAVARNNEHVANLYQPPHPAILRMIRTIIDSARAGGIDVGMCGEMAGDPRCALLLVGMGLRRLSMSPRRIPEIKTLLRRMSLPELERLAERCMHYSTAAEVQQQIDSFMEAAMALPGAVSAILSEGASA